MYKLTPPVSMILGPYRIFTPSRVFIGTHKVCCDDISLADTGIRFNKISSGPDRSRFNIIIPPTDIQEACFNSDTGFDRSTLIIVTVPESGFKICNALLIKPPTKQESTYSFQEGSLTIITEFANPVGLVIQENLEEYFSRFDDLNWRLQSIDTASVNDYIDLLTSTSVHSSNPEESTTKENGEKVNSILTHSSRTYSSLQSSTMFSPCRPSTPKSSPSLRPKAHILRPKSAETPSIIDIDTDDEDDTENQRNLSASGSCDGDIVLNYPNVGVDSITIYQRDLACLEEGEYLTDTILGFYLKFIERSLIEPVIAQRTYMFSTFFYHKLTFNTKNRKEEQPLNISDRYFNRVRNWTKNIDIFSKDFLIVPINKSYHWFVAIICYPRNVPDSDEILPIEIEKNSTRPCILFMDSLQSANTRCRLAEPLRHFLTKEWEYKHGTRKNFSRPVIQDMYLKVPKQHNSSDCGLYVLQYVESFLRNPDVLLKKVCQEENLEDWFSTSLVIAKRRTIKRQINNMRKQADEMKQIKSEMRMETDES